MGKKKWMDAKDFKPDFLKEMYRKMVLFRKFEETAHRAYTKGKFAGFCHLHIGQEAVCIGVQNNLRDTDYVVSGYRSHTQAIAKGIEPKAVMAELFGKATGCTVGKGGSMHMFSNEKRFLGGHGIVGGQVPLATGVGFKIRYDEEDDICVCYFGDGALNQGQVYESMNMAAAWNLPVLYIVENNQYGMGTHFSRVTSINHLWKRALAFDMDHSDADGMDPLAMYQSVGEIVKSMRKNPRPYFLEALTYRYRGHSVSDPATYRAKEELKSFQDKDPILKLAGQMIEAKIVDDAWIQETDASVKAEVKACEAYADESPEPELSTAYDHVFYEG